MFRSYTLARRASQIRDDSNAGNTSLRDLIVLGEVVDEIFPPASRISREYRALIESMGSPDDPARESKLRDNKDRFKTLANAVADTIGSSWFPFDRPRLRPSLLEGGGDPVRIADHLFYESALFKFAKWILGVSLVFVLSGALSLGFVSVDLRKRVDEVRKDIQASIAAALDDMNQRVQQATRAIEQKKSEFEAHVGSETKKFDTERASRIEEISAKIERELRDVLKERSIEPASKRVTTVLDDFTKEVHQRKALLDQNIEGQTAKVSDLQKMITAQEAKLSKLSSDFENLLLISRPSQEVARTLASGTTTNNLALIGSALELSVACLIAILILASASFIVSLSSAIVLARGRP